MKYNTANTNETTPVDEALEKIEALKYLGRIIDKQGWSDDDVEVSIDKTRVAFLRLKDIRNYKELPPNTEVRIFNTNIKSSVVQS